MKRHALLLAVGAIALVYMLTVPADPAAAGGKSQGKGDTPILIDQGGQRFPIWPVTGTLSISDWYDYNTIPASANTGLEMSQVSIVYFYKDETSGDLSLVITHDYPNDGTGGQVDFDMAGIPAGSTLPVEDDPGDINAAVDFTPPTASFSWLWLPCCTDGAAITLGEDDFDMSIFPTFNDGIQRWVALSLHPNGEIREVELDMQSDLRLVTPGFPPGR